MSSSAAQLVSAICGPILFLASISVVAFRKAPAFAVRVPDLLIAFMILKALAFAGYGWLLSAPDSCPCIVLPFVFWTDWMSNCWFTAKVVFLLFRYEIQAALKKSKEESNVVAFDEKNFFVRYRQVLRIKTQLWLMLALFLYVGLGNMIVLGVSYDFAFEPCVYVNILDNPMCLGCLLFAWVTAVPMMIVSTWASMRLRRFPNDNWKMGAENTINSIFTTCGAIACATALIVVPTFDGLIWVVFIGALVGDCLQFLVPLSLHRRTLSQLSKLDIKTFTSLDQLLQNAEFLDAFGAFLRKEFSSENLFFWLEVKKLRIQCQELLHEPARESSAGSHGNSGKKSVGGVNEKMFQVDPPDQTSMLMQAAVDCQLLGSRCIGEAAPWQLNISGFTTQEMEKVLATLRALTTSGSSEGLAAAVHEAITTLVMMQQEVYELLKKDPYPRFLLTADADKLNQNENFKRMLAAEKLEAEAQNSLGSEKRATTVDGSMDRASAEGSKNRVSAEGSKKKDSKNRSENKQRSSQFSYITEPVSPDPSERSDRTLEMIDCLTPTEFNIETPRLPAVSIGQVQPVF